MHLVWACTPPSGDDREVSPGFLFRITLPHPLWGVGRGDCELPLWQATIVEPVPVPPASPISWGARCCRPKAPAPVPPASPICWVAPCCCPRGRLEGASQQTWHPTHPGISPWDTGAARRRLHLYLRPPESAGWRPAAARGGTWRGHLSRRGTQHTQAFRHGTLGPNPFAPSSPFVPGPPGPVSAPVIATTVVVALVTGAGTLAPLPPPAKRRSRAIFTGSFREETRNVAPPTAPSRRRPKGRQGHRPMESSTYSAGRMPSLR